MLSLVSPIRVLLLCLFLCLTQGGIVPHDLSSGVTTITTTSVPTGDTYVYSCPAGPCTIDITSGVMFDLADGASLQLNDVTLKHETGSDAIRVNGVSSVTLNRVVISPVSTIFSVVHAFTGSSATIVFSQVTSSSRPGGGNTIFCESAALCDISVDSHTSTSNTDVFVKATLTSNLTAVISNSHFTSIAGTSTLAALFDAEDSQTTLTLNHNVFDTVTTRFLRFKETNAPVNNFALTMNGNNATKLIPAASSHAITFDKGLATIALNNNLFQLAAVPTTSFGLFGILTTSAGSSLTAIGNQLVANAVPIGHFYINAGFANVVLQDHYVTGCTGISTQGVNFASAVGGSLLVQNATFYSNAHSSGSIGMFSFANSPLLTSIIVRNSKFISNRLLGLAGDGLFSIKNVNLPSTTILFENNYFEDNIGLSQGSCIVFGTGSAGTATIRGTTFFNNRATSGAVRVAVSAQFYLTFDNCTFDSNLGTIDAAAIFSDGTTNNSTFYITNSRFVNNQGGIGGVMAHRSSSGGPIYFVNSYFANNVAASNGGVLQTQNSISPIYFIDSTFYNNSASFGGVLSIAFTTQTSFVVQGNVQFLSNKASTAGGVFYITGAGRGFLFENMHFESNSAPVGGAISVQSNMYNMTVNSCSFTSNTASTLGGGLHFVGAIPTISNSEFTTNNAPKGSAIAIVSSGATQLRGLTFTNEEANYGPLWLESGSGVVTASDLDFITNTGGAIYGTGTFTQSLSFTDIEVTENTDTDILSGVGDSIVTFDTFTGSVTFTDADFTENVVSTGSIIKFSGTGDLILDNCDFTSNEGSILYANEQVNVVMTNCEFESNVALAEADEDAKAMFSIFEVSSLSIESSTLTDDEYDLFFDLKTAESVSLSGVSLAAHSFEESLFNIDSTEVIFNNVNITIGDSDSLGTCFVLEKSASFTLTNTNVAKCQSTKAPALLFASGKSKIHITDSTFVDVTATLSSAFQVTESSQLTVADSSFTNVADGLFFISGSFASGTFQDTTVSQAVSSTSDASFFFINRGAHVSMTNVHVSDGESLSSGGCVIVDSGVLTWVGGSVSACSTSRQGAAFSFSGKVTAELRDLTVEGNSAFQGGAISMSQLFSSNVTIVNSQFNDHEAENGGVLYLAVPAGNVISFIDCTFDSNTATTFGGVLMGLDAAHIDFVDCTMTNNAAAYGGVGSLDWSSTVTLSSSTLQDNTASTSGGLFYLDKSSGVTIASSSISGSVAESGYGGAIYMAQSNVLTVTNSEFTDNSAMVDGGAISSPFGSKCTASISDSLFTGCSAGDKGGAISFSQFSASSLILERNTFSSNTAAYGGALSNQNAVNTPNVTTDIFDDNSASVYGDDVYSPPAALTTGSTSFHLLSGGTLPVITVTLRDNYGNEYDQPPPQFFFAFMSIEAVSNVTKAPYLSGTTSQQITNGHVSFSEIKAFALPGNYRIKLGPSVGNTFYTGPTYIVYIDLVVKACLNSEGNYQDFEDLGCMPILCSGCPTEKGATCVSPGNCSCPATLEGLQCEYLKDSYDSITLSFGTLPTLPTGHSSTEISVEMRDYILSELAKSYDTIEGLVVKFRSFVVSGGRRRAGSTFDFKYSLVLGNTPVEGELLNEYKDTAITYFTEEHGLGNSLESNVVSSDAAIVTYSDPVVIAVVVITAVFLALTIAFAVISVLKKDTPVIRSSSPLFCLLILLGISFAYVTPFSYIGTQTTLSCAAPVVLGPLSFSIVFGNLLAKTFRIYRIFANKTMRASSPTIFQLLGFSGAILGIEMLLVIIWLAVDPPVPVRMGPEGGRYWTCYSPLSSTMVPIIAAYDGVLLLFGVFLAFRTRNAFSAYKETQLIGFTIYTLSIVAVAILPVLYLIELPILAQFTIRSFSILFVATVTMFLLFGNKIVVILLLPERNTTEYFNNQNGSSSVKGGFMLRPTGRTQTMSTTGFDINDVKMSCQGWMMINENKPWSQWKNMYAVQTGEYFGFFENEDCSGHRGGLHPISQWVVERIQTDGHLQMKLTLGEHSCVAETPNPDDLEKWFNSLVKVAHVNL